MLWYQITPFFSLLIEDILDKLEDTMDNTHSDSEEEELETPEVWTVRFINKLYI